MCIALPGRIEWIGEAGTGSIPARIVVGAARHDVDLVMVPQARCGDYVIAHSGYAIRLVDQHEAGEVQRFLGVVDG